MAGDEIDAGTPRRLFDNDAYSWTGYDVTPDGRRIVITEALRPNPRDEIRIILDWSP